MAQKPLASKANRTLGKQGKITALSLLKNFYDEEIFRHLVKEFYNSDVEISEAAIRASGSLGNEIAISHLFQIIEKGVGSQRIEAIRAVAAIRAPSAAAQLLKYFTHFGENDVRTEILRAINTISPSMQQVQDLDQAVYQDPKQSDSVKQTAVEALVEAQKFSLLKDSLPRASSGVQEAAFRKMLQTGVQQVPDFTAESLSPSALGCYLCVHELKAKNPQQNYVMEKLQMGRKETMTSFMGCLSAFQGRLHYPTRIFRLLLISPYVDTETEIQIGDFLKKIVTEVKSSSPQLLSEFSVITSAHLDTVFTKCRKNYISLKGITNKEILLATLLASLLEKFGTPAVVETVQRFFKSEYSGFAPPVAQVKALLSRATKEDQNRLDACIPLFSLPEKKDKLQVFACLSRVDLNRPVYLRRLNRLLRIAGVLEIRTAAKKIQEILEFAREERIHYLEETSIVTLCQLLTRSIIEQSKEYFGQPDKSLRTLNGYLRGARFIPARIMIGPLVHLLVNPTIAASTRDLILDSLLSMDLSGVKRILPALLKCLDMAQFSAEQKLALGNILCRDADPSISHQLLDLTGNTDPAARRVAVRVLQALARRGEGVAAEVLTNRLYLLLEDKDRGVMVDALLALLAVKDDYAVQIVEDYIASEDAGIVSEILSSLGKAPSRETFALVMEALCLEDPGVQQALRTLLPDFCQGGFAEELRQALMEILTVIPGKNVPVSAPKPQTESLLGQAKLEFVFKRENTQELSVFFIDIAGYTEKSTAIDMSSLLVLIKTFEETVSSCVSANRGSVVKKMGDGILAAFKHPLAAVIAALTVQQKIAEHNSMRMEKEKFQARIGINTGKVIRKDNDIFGEVVNVASRMQSAATPGDILLTQATFEEVKKFVRCTELGRIQVKGIKEAITAYSPEEVLVDMKKLDAGDAASSSRAVADDSMAKLKESMFNPDFKLPADKADPQGTPAFLQGLLTDISRAVEELATDYHDEFIFKKYLQKKWDEYLKKA